MRAASLFQPVDGRAFAAFRVMFGLIVAASSVRALWLGWIQAHHIEPVFHFTWPGFAWVQPLPGDGPIYVAVGLALAGLLLAAGVRWAAPVCALGLAYEVLLDQALYLNHLYLAALLAGILSVVPWRRGAQVPAWGLWLLRFQVLVVYVFAGLSKIQPDWLALAPLRLTFEHFTGLPGVGPLMDQTWFIAAAAYGVIAVEVLAPPLLLWRRTRLFTLAVLVVFHLGTAVLYDIGIFPWLCLALLTLFLPPSWPGRLGVRASEPRDFRPRRGVVAGLAVYGLVQLGLPLRPYFVDGDASWTREAHQFSWRLLLAHKSGWVRFTLVDRATGERDEVSPLQVLTGWQTSRLGQDPALIRQFARWLAAAQRAQGRDVAVHALSGASLNGRAMQPLVDAAVDLTRDDPFVVPLSTALPPTPTPPDGAVIEANRWGPKHLFRSGLAAQKAERWTAAAEAYHLFLLIEPLHVGAQLNLSLSLRRAGQVSAARRWLERLVERQPDALAGWRELVGLLVETGASVEAQAAAERGLGHHPQDPVLRQIARR